MHSSDSSLGAITVTATYIAYCVTAVANNTIGYIHSSDSNST